MFPDVQIANNAYPIQFGSGEWMTVITRCSGIFTGEMKQLDGTKVAPTGKAFDLDFATTAKWDGDLLVGEYVFWDSALQAQQIGLA